MPDLYEHVKENHGKIYLMKKTVEVFCKQCNYKESLPNKIDIVPKCFCAVESMNRDNNTKMKIRTSTSSVKESGNVVDLGDVEQESTSSMDKDKDNDTKSSTATTSFIEGFGKLLNLGDVEIDTTHSNSVKHQSRKRNISGYLLDSSSNKLKTDGKNKLKKEKQKSKPKTSEVGTPLVSQKESPVHTMFYKCLVEKCGTLSKSMPDLNEHVKENHGKIYLMKKTVEVFCKQCNYKESLPNKIDIVPKCFCAVESMKRDKGTKTKIRTYTSSNKESGNFVDLVDLEQESTSSMDRDKDNNMKSSTATSEEFGKFINLGDVEMDTPHLSSRKHQNRKRNFSGDLLDSSSNKLKSDDKDKLKENKKSKQKTSEEGTPEYSRNAGTSRLKKEPSAKYKGKTKCKNKDCDEFFNNAWIPKICPKCTKDNGGSWTPKVVKVKSRAYHIENGTFSVRQNVAGKPTRIFVTSDSECLDKNCAQMKKSKPQMKDCEHLKHSKINVQQAKIYPLDIEKWRDELERLLDNKTISIEDLSQDFAVYELPDNYFCCPYIYGSDYSATGLVHVVPGVSCTGKRCKKQKGSGIYKQIKTPHSCIHSSIIDICTVENNNDLEEKEETIHHKELFDKDLTIDHIIKRIQETVPNLNDRETQYIREVFIKMLHFGVEKNMFNSCEYLFCLYPPSCPDKTSGLCS